jgi:hypothetical protein
MKITLGMLLIGVGLVGCGGSSTTTVGNEQDPAAEELIGAEMIGADEQGLLGEVHGIEGENLNTATNLDGSTSGYTEPFNDCYASQGKTRAMWSRSTITGWFHAPYAGRRRMQITARGTKCAGAFPLIRVYVRNYSGLDNSGMNTTNYAQYYGGTWYLPQGYSQYWIEFPNDCYINGEDRNLFVDYVAFRDLE